MNPLLSAGSPATRNPNEIDGGVVRRLRRPSPPSISLTAGVGIAIIALQLSMAAAVRLPTMAAAHTNFQNFDMVLNATDLYIHYGYGYFRGPNASIDLSDLVFEATSWKRRRLLAPQSLAADTADDRNGGGRDATTSHLLRQHQLQPQQRMRNKKEEDVNLDDRWHHTQHQPRKLDDGGKDAGGTTYIDIVNFKLPEECASSKLGCDWTELGIGGRVDDPDGGSSPVLRWCCTGDAIALGLCKGGHDYGRLIIGPKFKGLHYRIDVPQRGPMKKKLSGDVLTINETGRYVLAFANCDPSGRQVTVTGKVVWTTSFGYLAGMRYGCFFFYVTLLVGYAVLFVWFCGGMRRNGSSSTSVEKWIVVIIGLSVVEMMLRIADYVDWIVDGDYIRSLTYAGGLVGVIKDGISRCLLVMVSLGWGVIRDALRPHRSKIVALGVVYVLCAALSLNAVTIAELNVLTISYSGGVKLFDSAVAFNFLVVAALNIVFILWTLDELCATLSYLANDNKSRNDLVRYLRLRTIVLLEVLFAVVWAGVSLADLFVQDGTVREEHDWIMSAATELNFWAVLVGIAVLWSPRPTGAKGYVNVTEELTVFTATMGSDGHDDHELELLELTDAVPLARRDDIVEVEVTDTTSHVGENANPVFTAGTTP